MSVASGRASIRWDSNNPSVGDPDRWPPGHVYTVSPDIPIPISRVTQPFSSISVRTLASPSFRRPDTSVSDQSITLIALFRFDNRCVAKPKSRVVPVVLVDVIVKRKSRTTTFKGPSYRRTRHAVAVDQLIRNHCWSYT